MTKKSGSCKRYFKEYDAFGHNISLNFDRKGDKHRTLCGGLSSILLGMFLISVVGIQVWIIYWRQQNVISQFPIRIDFEEFGELDL